MYHIKTDKRSIQSSQRMYSALEELMGEKPYTDITVTDIVDRAQLGRTTFYRHFDTIDDVLRMKCDEKYDGLAEYFLEYHRMESRGNKTLFLKPFLRYWYIHSAIIELLIKAGRQDIIKDSFQKMMASYRDFILEGREDVGDHFTYFSEIRAAVSISILTEWIKNKKNIPPDDLAEVIISQLKSISM